MLKVVAADANDSTAMDGVQPAPLTLADLQQDPAVYTFPARIRYSEVDHNAQLTLPSLVNCTSSPSCSN